LVGQSSGYVENLPEAVREKVAALEELQGEQRKLQRQFEREVIELERKFEKLYEPVFSKVHFLYIVPNQVSS
jgi:nucleosome assembly protein 1-like 1